MVQKKHTVHLASDYLPALATDIGSTVIMLGPDQSYASRRIIAQDQSDANSGLPQVLWMAGFLPVQKGFASVDYIQVNVGGAITSYTFVDELHEMRGADPGEYIKLAVAHSTTTSDSVILYATPGTGWRVALGVTLPASSVPILSVARAQGQDYLLIRGVGLFVYTWSSDSWALLSMGGLVDTDILGLVAVSGYLLAYDQDSIAWSTTLNLVPDPSLRSTAYALGDTVYEDGFTFLCTTAGTTDVTEPAWLTASPTLADGTLVWTFTQTIIDFVPSETTGAGGGAIEDATGPIVYAKPIVGGCIIYTTTNAVAALYTNNATFPFIFKPINSCGGVRSGHYVTDSDTQNGHYVWTGKGLQLVSTTGAKAVFGEWARCVEATLLLGKAPLYAWDSGAGTVTSTLIDVDFTQLVFCGGRYLCAAIEAYIFVYDVTLSRGGSIFNQGFIFDHEWAEDLVMSSTKSVGTIGSYGPTGILSAVLPFGNGATPSSGFIMLGNFKHVLEQDITLCGIELFSTAMNATAVILAAYLLISYDGRTWGKSVPLTVDSSKAATGYFKIDCCEEGVSVALFMQCNINLSQMVLTYTSGGHTT